MGVSVAAAAEEELKRRPHQLRSLLDGVVNYRALARSLKPEVEERLGEEVEEEAVVSALRRAEGEVSPDARTLEDSRVTLRRGVGVMTVPAGVYAASDMVKTARSVSNPELLRIVQGERKTTVVAHEDDLPTVKEALQREPLFEEEGLAEVIVTSPEDIETEPGIIAEMTSRLAARGVNILEMMSCNTDTIIVVAEADAEKAVGALEF